VNVIHIKHFDPKDWDKNKYYKVKCGDGKCTGIIIFVRGKTYVTDAIVNSLENSKFCTHLLFHYRLSSIKKVTLILFHNYLLYL